MKFKNEVMEIRWWSQRQMVDWEAQGDSGPMEKVLCLILMMVTWVYVIVKTHRSENLSSLYFIIPNNENSDI